MGRFFGIALIIVIIVGILAWSITHKAPGHPQPQNNMPTPTPKEQNQVTTPTPVGKSSKNITIRTPKDNDTIGLSFQVTGEARVFENVVSYRVRNQKTNTAIVTGTTTADSPDVGQFGPFTITIIIPEDVNLHSGDILKLEVFQASPKDGSDTDLVSIPLKYQDGE